MGKAVEKKEEQLLEKEEEHKTSKFQKFIFVVLIPLLFAITLGLIGATFLGVNVFEKAKQYGEKIPLVSNLMKGSNPTTVKDIEKNMVELEAQIKDREAKLTQLESKMEGKDKEIERLNLEKKRLEKEIQDLTAAQQDNKKAFKDIVTTYESMEPKKVAPIITQMSDEQAVKILSNLTADSLAQIMQSMAPKDAAKYTTLLTNQKEQQITTP